MTVTSPIFSLKPALKLDHLVIAARTLDEGARYVAARLGVETAAGGAHPLMRTHNRLLNLYGGAYLEVIAIDPAAAPLACSRSTIPRCSAVWKQPVRNSSTGSCASSA